MDHLCAAEQCQIVISEQFLMCPAHWRRVPKPLQRRIYREWRNGRPTTDYTRTVREAVEKLKG